MTRFLVCALLLVTACKKGSKSEATDPGSGSATTGSATTGSATTGSATTGSATTGSATTGSAVASGSGSSAVAVDAAAPAGSGSAAAVTRPKEVAELEATLVALINEPESDARSRKTCEMTMDIKKKTRAVARMTKPAGVDQAAWDAANHAIANSLDAMGPYCNDDPPDDSIELPNLYKNLQALLALLPK